MITPEIEKSLKQYADYVLLRNKDFNLISASQNADTIWQRHILDSIQIYQLFPSEAKIICDFGSGAGFPAIPCAIISKFNNDKRSFFMYESIGKKARFLEEAINILKLDNISVKNIRIESEANLKADLITARAFAKIDETFKIAKNFLKKDTSFLLLKGRNCDEEIKVAQKKFAFNYTKNPSSTGDGVIFSAKLK
jgi:16S rRNA (guanine527-N7)-methyltransferase